VDILVVDHHDSYTWNLVHLVAEVAHRDPVVVQHDDVGPRDLQGRSHLILSPGPGHPDVAEDFGTSRALILSATMPVLGVCLGLQGLVTTYGGRVDRVRPAHGEVATVTHDGRGIFRGVPDGFRAVRYHSLAATRVPPALHVTAHSEDGTVMGVRHRSRPFVGVQFHPESVLSEHGAQLIANFLGLG
jgi:anthranilate synthase/aminodeoxychorismate synthase-like glutamine amidotransferase